MIAGKTGRHTFTQWDQVLMHEGAHHPALNPYTLPENKGLRLDYPEGMCKRSLDILNRTVMVATHPLHGDAGDRGHRSTTSTRRRAWRWKMPRWTMSSCARPQPVDLQKFDA